MDNEERKVLVIGLDGATFDLINPWAEAGYLPNIKNLINKGTQGSLESTMPPITSPAWPSFMTGKNPGKHGCFDFTKSVDKGIRAVGVVSAYSIRSKTIWNVLSNAGKQVGVLNVPVTYPPEIVNGFMISGMLTPGNEGVSYPKELILELGEKVRKYRVGLTELYREGNEEAFLKDILSLTAEREEITLWLMRNKPWDVFMVVFAATDLSSHYFWKYVDKDHPAYMGDNNGFNDAILKCYRRVDEAVGKLMKEAGKDTYIFLISDHGAGPLHKTVNYNLYLINHGYLRLKKGFRNAFRLALFNLGFSPNRIYWLIKKMHLEGLFAGRSLGEMHKDLSNKFLSYNDVDWDGTKAFSRGTMGQIFITAKEREYKHVQDELVKALYEMTDPDTGERVVTNVIKREEVYSGRFLKGAPNLFVIAQNYRYYSYPLFASENAIYVPQIQGKSGHHRPYGIFIAYGPEIKQNNQIGGAKIIDVTPTILHTINVPIPEDMDGKVLKSIYNESSRLYTKKISFQSTEEENKVERTIKHLKISGKI